MNMDKIIIKDRKKKSSNYSKRRKELYKRRTICETPTVRPIKKSTLAQIFKLNQRFLNILKEATIQFHPNNPNQTAWNQIPN